MTENGKNFLKKLLYDLKKLLYRPVFMEGIKIDDRIHFMTDSK